MAHVKKEMPLSCQVAQATQTVGCVLAAATTVALAAEDCFSNDSFSKTTKGWALATLLSGTGAAFIGWFYKDSSSRYEATETPPSRKRTRTVPPTETAPRVFSEHVPPRSATLTTPPPLSPPTSPTTTLTPEEQAHTYLCKPLSAVRKHQNSVVAFLNANKESLSPETIRSLCQKYCITTNAGTYGIRN
jgi:hypothetical protein